MSRTPRRPNEIGDIGRAVATNIRALRRRHGLTLDQVAAAMNDLGRPLLQATVSKAELAERRIDVDDLVAFAAALHVEPATLLIPPTCDACLGAPPPGFTCNTCGAGGQP